jgi:uncharacterized membrane protein YeaQ/YmgE (transglycosylase-associated protein family)
MGIIAWIVLGAIAGFIANLIMGSHEGLVMMVVLGIVGALVGGFVAGTVLNVSGRHRSQPREPRRGRHWGHHRHRHCQDGDGLAGWPARPVI